VDEYSGVGRYDVSSTNTTVGNTDGRIVGPLVLVVDHDVMNGRVGSAVMIRRRYDVGSMLFVANVG